MDLRCTWKYLISLICIIMAVNATGADIVINEMLSNPASDWNKNGDISGMDDEFVELFNAGKEPVDVSGYVMKDTVFRSTPGEYRMPNGTTIKPGEFLAIFVSSSGVFQGNDGDCIRLFDPSGNLVDQKEYKVAMADVSFARIPDGGEWGNSTTPTPGMPNQ
ncbi:MAG: lamin tail domain-containing protein [Methanothrix sp.]|nr:lamin tail domain-containing protein [Methanothrix sp.]